MRHSGRGPGRVIVTVYAILALAATARATVQIATKGSEAPLAYALSLAAGIVYIVATISLARDGRWRPVAWAAVGIEMIGVVTVGILSLVAPQDFPDATVWSQFGRGYGWIPLVLPAVGMWWLWRTRPRQSGTM
ncbi:hypothetical protein [Rarobacter incanus]|nr:hypothetical protein [Rarobacter incanus]